MVLESMVRCPHPCHLCGKASLGSRDVRPHAVSVHSELKKVTWRRGERAYQRSTCGFACYTKQKLHGATVVA